MDVNEWMPCIGETGLQIFTTTADQRYQLGSKRFLETHFPMELRQAEEGRVVKTNSENWLLSQLLEMDASITGNRVFVLYGAAGSGKSEVMRWMLTRIGQEHPLKAAITVRISRTDLDVIKITERFYNQLSGNYFETSTHERWNNLQQKPLTLAKILVLSALERLLSDDATINALFYWLIEPVQLNLEQASMSASENEESVLELFSQEDWVKLCQQTELADQLDAEELRQQLVKSFQQQILEGISLSDTLRLISEDIQRTHGIRPILLIDDLVRSLNLFAGELMDFFITLDSGNWDVVIGLTPASLQMHRRGQELVERIGFLDTIDDRVQKLWLSDDFGHDSYFLNETNCHQFVSRYLQAYRNLNGCECQSCPARSRCEGLGEDGTGVLLAPFNQEALVRVFRALPNGKGKARYMLRSLRSVLQSLLDGELLLASIHRHVHLDSAARCADETLAGFAEIYGPLVTVQRSVRMDSGLQTFLGREDTGLIEMEPLQRIRQTYVRTVDMDLSVDTVQFIDDPGKQAVRDWLLSRPVNRQLLQPLRQGLGRFLRLLDQFNGFHRAGVARPTGKLHTSQAYMKTSPPITLEGLDDGLGICINRTVGNCAYDLYRYHTAKGTERRLLEQQLLSESDLVYSVYDAVAQQEKSLHQLEEQLGIPVEQLTLGLFLLHGCVYGVQTSDIPGLKTAQLPSMRPQFPQSWQHLQSFFSNQDGPAIHALFDDYFQLRLNLYDGPSLHRLISEKPIKILFESIQSISVEHVSDRYRLGRRTLQAVLTDAQALLHELRRAESETSTNGPSASVSVLSSPQWIRNSLASQSLEDLVQQMPSAQLMPEAATAMLVKLLDELHAPQDAIMHKQAHMPDGRTLRIIAW